MNRTGLVFGLMIVVIVVVTLAGCGGSSSDSPPPTAPLTIDDDFANVNSGWPLGDNDSYHRHNYVSGGYEMELKVQDWQAWVCRYEVFTRYTVSVGVTNLSPGNNPECGLLFNYFNGENGGLYTFTIIPEQQEFRIRRLDGSMWMSEEDIYGTSPAIDSANGALNNLKIVFEEDNKIELFINGSLVRTLTNFVFHPNNGEKIGLVVLSKNPATLTPFTVRFSDYHISGDFVTNTATPTPTATPSPTPTSGA
jgi:hypothetical protein